MEDATLAINPASTALEDEASLVASARSDPAAFTELYRRYVTPVYRYLYKWVGNQAEAEELTSQVFTDVLEGLVRYQERGSFAAWLFTIARRRAIAAYRRRRPMLGLEDAEGINDQTEEPLDQVVRSEQLERMAALFAGLDEDQRELLRLRFTAGLSYAEISDLLGRSEGAVKMAVHRLLRQMNEKWEE